MERREDFVGAGQHQLDRRSHARKSMFVMVSCKPIPNSDIHFYMSHPNRTVLEQIEEYATLQRELNEALVDYTFHQGSRPLIHTAQILSCLTQIFNSGLRQVLSNSLNMRRLPVNLSLGGIYIPCAPSEVGFDEAGRPIGHAVFRDGDFVAVYIMPESQPEHLPTVTEVIGKIRRISHVSTGKGIPDTYALGIEFVQPLGVLKPLLSTVLGSDQR